MRNCHKRWQWTRIKCGSWPTSYFLESSSFLFTNWWGWVWLSIKKQIIDSEWRVFLYQKLEGGDFSHLSHFFFLEMRCFWIKHPSFNGHLSRLFHPVALLKVNFLPITIKPNPNENVKQRMMNSNNECKDESEISTWAANVGFFPLLLLKFYVFIYRNSK